MSKIKVLASLISPETSLLGLLMTVLCLWFHMAFSCCLCVGERQLSISASFRSPIGLGPAFVTSFNLNYLLTPNTVILGEEELGLQHTDLGGHGSVHSIR